MHLPFDELQPRYLALRLAVGPLLDDGIADGGEVALHIICEGAHEASFCGFKPLSKVGR